MRMESHDTSSLNKACHLICLSLKRGGSMKWQSSNQIMHYDDVTMDSIASQITSLTIVYSTVHSGTDQRKHQSSASLAFVWEIHRWPVNFPHKWSVTRKMFPFDDVIMDFREVSCCYTANSCVHVNPAMKTIYWSIQFVTTLNRKFINHFKN